MSPVIPLTNEPHYDVPKEESSLCASAIASLWERTKQKGRGESLATILHESQAKEKMGKRLEGKL